MKINHKLIKELNPCESRYENFKKHYPDFNSDLEEFLYLEEISYSDKVWVFTRLATKEQNIKWSIMCADSVLHIFEDKYPTDLRPRAALESAERCIINPTEEIRKDANAAANAANDAYAAYAYAAAYAAYAANAAYAYAAANAAYAAANAAYAYAAANAANDAYAANAAEKQQEQLNLIFMIEAVK